MSPSTRPAPLSRRSFLTAAVATLAAPYVLRGADASPILGQGDFRYRVVPGWGQLDAKTPVDDCHGIVCNREGNIILLTNEPKNNFLVYDPQGKLLHKWGTAFPGAHGLSLVEEAGKEVLYFTDLKRHRVFKATPAGEMLAEWVWPRENGKYAKEDDYRPSWTLHQSSGDFFVLDGYGKDFILHYGPAGKLAKTFGGAEGGVEHWGPHGGMLDERANEPPTLLIGMSDQQYLLRMSLDGKRVAKYELPGGNPRQIRRIGEHYFVAHLADNWPKDRKSRGFLSVLDKDLKVLSNIAGTPPAYQEGKLQPMRHQEDVFIHPHDLAVGKDGSIYVAQFASGKTYPMKLERV